jgi:hypothetical protein
MDEKCDAALPITSHPEDTYDDAFCTGVRQYCLYIADLQGDQPDARNTTTETLPWLWTKTLAPGAQFERGDGRGAQ